jgi:hypothetical protein
MLKYGCRNKPADEYTSKGADSYAQWQIANRFANKNSKICSDGQAEKDTDAKRFSIHFASPCL